MAGPGVGGSGEKCGDGSDRDEDHFGKLEEGLDQELWKYE